MELLAGIPIAFLFVVFIVISILFSSVRIVQEYERGVVFRLGRLTGARGPGLIILIPFLERMRIIDLRTITMDVPPQEVITRDNVTIKVNAVIYFRVVNPSDAVTRILDYVKATSQIAQTTLRSTLGQSELDELLSKRDEINARLQQIIDEQTEAWGIKVSVVEVRDLELPQNMQRAMARQAEAEREKRAKIIHADGELQASRTLADAATIMASSPSAIQLRYLQTLTDMSNDRTSMVVFPLPIDLISAFTAALKPAAEVGRPGEPQPRPAAMPEPNPQQPPTIEKP